MKIEELEELVKRRFELKDEIAKIKREEIDSRTKELAKVDGKIIEQLEEMEVNSFKSKYGSITKSTRYSYKVPKAEEDKKAFFKWLYEAKGETYYWSKVNIASASLGSIANEHMAIARESGDMHFKIPGLSEATANVFLKKS